MVPLDEAGRQSRSATPVYRTTLAFWSCMPRRAKGTYELSAVERSHLRSESTMKRHEASIPIRPPEPGSLPDSPERDPLRQPRPEPWHDPGPPVRKVNLPPDSPGTGIPIREPDRTDGGLQ